MNAADPVRLAAVVADGTRFAVYRHLVEAAPRPVSAQEIAERFHLHPNVARLHLNRLEEIGLVVSDTERSGRGGRPYRVYRPSGQALHLSLPPRDYQLLSELLCRALTLLGDRGLEALEEVGRRHGREVAQDAAGRLPAEEPVTEEALLGAVADVLSEQGLLARVAPSERGAVLTLHNCSFAEVADRFPQLICRLCRGLVQGVLASGEGASAEEAAGAALRGEESRAKGDARCAYVLET